MKKEMAETLVRTGPGTPMGNLMRRYWTPILLSSEIAEPDCPQVRARILGEKLLAPRRLTKPLELVGRKRQLLFQGSTPHDYRPLASVSITGRDRDSFADIP